jgi:hypothetical protein
MTTLTQVQIPVSHGTASVTLQRDNGKVSVKEFVLQHRHGPLITEGKLRIITASTGMELDAAASDGKLDKYFQK